MWEIEQLKIKKKKKKKNCWRKYKFRILSLEPFTQKLSTSTGFFWLKHISAPHYKHFTI